MRMAATWSGATESSRSACRDARQALGRRVGVATEVAIDIGEGGQMDAGQERLVAAAIVRVRARHAGRPEGPTVEAAPEGDDARPPGHAASHLERALDRLRARIEEEDRVEWVGHLGRDHLGQPVDGLREADRVGRAMSRSDLRMDGGRHGRMVVAERRDGDAIGKVEIAVPSTSKRRWPSPWLQVRSK